MNETQLAKNKTINIIGAVLLSFLTLGLGQISSGKIKRGVLIYGVSLILIPVAFYICVQPITPFNIVIPAILFIGWHVFVIVDSVCIARNPENRLKMKPIIVYLLLICIWQVDSRLVNPIIAGTIKQDFLQAFKIPSGAMLPTLLIGDHLLSDKYIYNHSDPKRGDIVIFPYPVNPKQDFIKRVVAIEGDTIEIKEKQVYLNGELLHEP